MTLTIHFNLVPRLRKGGATHPLTIYHYIYLYSTGYILPKAIHIFSQGILLITIIYCNILHFQTDVTHL